MEFTDVTATFGKARKIFAASLGNVAAGTEFLDVPHGLGRVPAFVILQALPGLSDGDLTAFSLGVWAVQNKDATNIRVRKQNIAASNSVNRIAMVQVFKEFPIDLLTSLVLGLAVNPPKASHNPNGKVPPGFPAAAIPGDVLAMLASLPGVPFV